MRPSFIFIFLISYLLASGTAQGGDSPKPTSNAVSIKGIFRTSNTHPGWSPNISTWIPPADMSRDCPYYQAGYDFEGRPVMVAEFGKWNSKKYIEEGNETYQTYLRFNEKFFWRMVHLKAVDPDAEEGVTFIIDYAGFDYKQVSTPSLIGFALRMAHFSSIAEPVIAEIIAINISHAVRVFLNVFGSVSGRLVGRLEVYNSKEWKIKLLSKIPRDQLPPKYGGKNTFEPVVTYA